MRIKAVLQSVFFLFPVIALVAGCPPHQVTVPDVRGLTQAAAETRLEQIGTATYWQP